MAYSINLQTTAIVKNDIRMILLCGLTTRRLSQQSHHAADAVLNSLAKLEDNNY
jgi:hypothetical protein